MAKTLKQILDGVKSSKTKTKDILGKKPGVDYSPKAGDERKFADKHHEDEHADRAGNGDDVYKATNVKSYMDTDKSNHHGYKAGEDEKVYEAETIPSANDPNKRKMTPDELKGVLGDGPNDSAKTSTDTNLKSLDALLSGSSPLKKPKPNNNSSTNEETVLEAKCNMTGAGVKCDVHGMKKCTPGQVKEETNTSVATHKKHAQEHAGLAKYHYDSALASVDFSNGPAKVNPHRSALSAHHGAEIAHHAAAVAHQRGDDDRFDRTIAAHEASKKAHAASEKLNPGKLKEGIEWINELSKKTLANYIGAASADKSFAAHDMGKINQRAATTGTSHSDRVERDRLNKQHSKRSGGIGLAANKLAKEEVDNINELLVHTYVSGPKNKRAEIHKDMNSGNYNVKKMLGDKLVDQKKFEDSTEAHAHAKKHISEDSEQLDELGGAYSKPARVPQRMIQPKAAERVAKIADRKKMSHDDVQKVLFNQGHGRKSEKLIKSLRKEETVIERKMTDSEKDDRERIVKGMKKKVSDFRSRYGNRSKNVMYATATKQAMREEKTTNPVTGHYMRDGSDAYEEGHFVGRKGHKTTNPFPKSHPHHADFERGVKAGSATVKEEKEKKKTGRGTPAVTPNTLPDFSVDVNTGRNV